MLSWREGVRGRERRRGIIGSESQVGRGDERSVLLGVRAEG